MPIQGLEKAPKDDLLTKVLNKQYSLKEMREAAEGIKRKKNIVREYRYYLLNVLKLKMNKKIICTRDAIELR